MRGQRAQQVQAILGHSDLVIITERVDAVNGATGTGWRALITG